MTTWYEAGLRTNAEVWRSIRGRRASPPVPLGSDQRRVTFQSALEQAEQQFRAAALVDFDSRALNLFYGLSQAGRALAAASVVLPNSDWRLTGHGLRLSDIDGTKSNLASMVVKSDGKGDSSFRRLSTILDSDQPVAVTLGELWPLIFDTGFGPRLSDSIYIPLMVDLQTAQVPSGSFVAQSATVELPSALLAIPVKDRPLLAEYLSRYPALNGWVTITPVGSTQDWPGTNMQFTLRWKKPDSLINGHILDRALGDYRGNTLAFPTLLGASTIMHPLMSWWMVLFSLSMLTRYQPDVWTRLIDVNRSSLATAIEYLLETALSAVPDLIDEAIDQVRMPHS